MGFLRNLKRKKREKKILALGGLSIGNQRYSVLRKGTRKGTYDLMNEFSGNIKYDVPVGVLLLCNKKEV